MTDPAPAPATTPAPTDRLVDRLGYEFRDPSFLDLALRHRSWCVEHPGDESNERLEFLGDAILGAVVASVLYDQHPDLDEGRLTDARKSVVSTSGLAPAAARLGLGESLLLGRGEEQSGGREKPSLLENTFEAVIGAIFLDSGWAAAKAFVERHLADALEASTLGEVGDFKSRLQEELARRAVDPPRYEVLSEGPDHAKVFSAEVWVEGQPRGRGQGRSKKQAEQAAASAALASLSPVNESESSRA